MTSNFRLAVVIPLLAAITIVIFSGGLGILFIVLNKIATEWAVIIVGMSLTIGVPTIAALLQRKADNL